METLFVLVIYLAAMIGLSNLFEQGFKYLDARAERREKEAELLSKIVDRLE